MAKFLDDILILLGGLCIVYGLSLINIALAWIFGGVFIICLAWLIAKAKGKANVA